MDLLSVHENVQKDGKISFLCDVTVLEEFSQHFTKFFKIFCMMSQRRSDKRGPSPRLRTHATEVQWQTLDRAHNLLQRLVSFFFQAEKISVVSF